MPTKKLREEIEHFHNFLRRKGLKKTYQKDLILETFLNTEGHLSVEDVYAQVKKRDKRVGVVTVFRTLKSLTNCGIAREINLGDGLTRFEHCYHHPYHHHIICKKCHTAIEFVCPELESIQDKVIKKYRFRPDHHRFQTYGVCEDCLADLPSVSDQKHDTEKIFARDALKMTLDTERRFLEFYRESARRNIDLGGKEIFSRMVSEEENLIRDLRSKLLELEQQEKDLDRAPTFLHFDLEELEAMIPDLTGFEKEEGLCLDAQTAIELSSDLNRRSSAFYKKYAERFTDTLGKRIFMNFADQEEQHSHMMSKTADRGLQTGI